MERAVSSIFAEMDNRSGVNAVYRMFRFAAVEIAAEIDVTMETGFACSGAAVQSAADSRDNLRYFILAAETFAALARECNLAAERDRLDSADLARGLFVLVSSCAWAGNLDGAQKVDAGTFDRAKFAENVKDQVTAWLGCVRGLSDENRGGLMEALAFSDNDKDRLLSDLVHDAYVLPGLLYAEAVAVRCDEAPFRPSAASAHAENLYREAGGVLKSEVGLRLAAARLALA